MSNLSTFLFIFVGILIVAGWISSEMISSKATKANKKSSIRSAKLEKENNQLTHTLVKEQEKYKGLRTEYEKAREARDQLKEFEKEYKKLVKSYNVYTASVETLKELVSAKKYSSNALSKEVLTHIDTHCPSDEKAQKMKDESTQAAFKRIKERMASNEASSSEG